MFSASTNIQQVFAAIAMRGPKALRAAELGAIKAIQTKAAPAIKLDAQAQTPTMFRTLQKSAQKINLPTGAAITFGGQASDYAALVHEGFSGPHTGPRKGKYVYLAGGAGFTRSGDWNPIRTQRLVRGRRQKGGRYTWKLKTFKTRKGRAWQVIGEHETPQQVAKKAKRNWRRGEVHYLQRLPAASKPKNPKGTAFFLFGRPFSAFEHYREKTEMMMLDGAAAGLAMILPRGGR
jgi:hypothetical protein